MEFAHPKYIWLFLLYIPLIAWYIYKHLRGTYPTMAMSSLDAFAQTRRSWREIARHSLLLFRLGAIGCLIIVLMRPQIHDNWRTTSTEGTDIVLSLDISGSMLAKDFQPNRLEAAKSVASKFIQSREHDGIGVVAFAGEPLRGVPLTTYHPPLLSFVHDLSLDYLEFIEDGTAIGDGIISALNRIRNGNAKSKSVILLTDGSNNTGIVAPLTAAQAAKDLGVKIYTVGVGTNSPSAPMPVYDQFGNISYQNMPVVIDENTLMQIADITHGKYFRATDKDVLQKVFDEIDQLEKTQIDVRHFSHTEDDYMLWAWLAFGLFAVELLLRYTVFRVVP